LQVTRQAPVLLLSPPRSHCSIRLACSKPSPHFGLAQMSVQPSSLSPFLPSSQTSPGSGLLLPQASSSQVALQPSPASTFPSSQASPGPTAASPQTLSVQSSLQALPGPLSLPSSQTSLPPSLFHRLPSPQVASWQVEVQAPLSLLSAPASQLHRRPDWQLVAADGEGAGVAAASVLSALPSSQALAGADHAVAAAGELAGVAALVVVDVVAVVAALGGADHAVAADVGDAIGRAGAGGAVVRAVVAGLARVDLAVAADARGLRRWWARRWSIPSEVVTGSLPVLVPDSLSVVVVVAVSPVQAPSEQRGPEGRPDLPSIG
jgi:hypothetical protein